MQSHRITRRKFARGDKDGAAVLDTAVTGGVPKSTRAGAKAAVREAAGLPGASSLRRDLGEDFAPRRTSLASVGERIQEDEDFVPRRRFGGLRFRVSGGVPKSVIGRVVVGGVALAVLGVMIAGIGGLRSMLLSNSRLVLESSSAVQITGNNHLTRAQLLTVFGQDVDRNILTVPLEARRAELERLPWVQHATVMRLLPNRFRVAIVERKPVAFVRQGSWVGLVDATGVLLDMASDGDAPGYSGAETRYSFPVITGIARQDPLSTRAARVKLFARFMTELGGQSKHVSEVDLSSPEDVKALIQDGDSDILVHFGDKDFLHRYELYEKNLPGWKKEYPKLASADMRYERQVVLEMQPGVAETDGSHEKKAPGPAGAKSMKPKRLAETGHTAVSAPHPAVAKHLTKAFDVNGKSTTTVKTHPKSTQAGPQ